MVMLELAGTGCEFQGVEVMSGAKFRNNTI